MPTNKKFIPHIIWIILASFLGVGVSYLVIQGGTLAYGAIYSKTQESNLNKNSVNPQNAAVAEVIVADVPNDIAPKEENISIGIVGDIIPDINISANLFSGVISHTERPDVMIGNFEGVATSNVYSKCKPNSTNCFSFNGNGNFLKLLSDTSFDVLNVANNHFNDYGKIGQEETLKEIREAGIVGSGMKDEITYIKRRDSKIALVGFSNYAWTSDLNNTKKVKDLVGAAKQNADIVIVIFHGGGEGAKYAHTPSGIEWYLGENRGDVRSFAHNAIDAGADIVLGSGPHVLRGIEWYNDKLIAYSLGNFAAANTFLTSDDIKISAMLEVEFDKKGSIISGKIFSFEIDKHGTPHPDSNNTAIYDMNNLSKTDFGESGAVLNSEGEIEIK